MIVLCAIMSKMVICLHHRCGTNRFLINAQMHKDIVCWDEKQHDGGPINFFIECDDFMTVNYYFKVKFINISDDERPTYWQSNPITTVPPREELMDTACFRQIEGEYCYNTLFMPFQLCIREKYDKELHGLIVSVTPNVFSRIEYEYYSM